MPAGVGGGGRIQPATSSILDPTADSMPATSDQVLCDVINARREAQPYFLIYPSRGCVSSQQSILRSLRNVIRNSRPGTLFGRGNRALLVLGDVPNAAARRQTAACVSGHGSQTGAGSQLGQGTAVRTAGEWWKSREVSDRSGRQTAPDFARSDIRFSLFDGECPRRRSIGGKSSLPTKAGAMRKAAWFLRDFRPASGGGRAFFGAPGMARIAVTGAIRPECCPVDDLEVRVLSWAPPLF